MVSATLCAADTLKVLIVGSTSDLGDKYGSDSAAFSPTAIASELEKIISQNGPGSATVTVEERFNNNLPTGFVYDTATFPSDSYNLTGWFHFPLPAGSESNRWANLRGADGTAWDYVVIIGDPYTMEKTPGMYAQGVAVVADSPQFSASTAELSEPAYVGTMLTVQTSAGFLLTLVTIHLVPMMADLVGWRFAFVILAPGPFIGIVAMWRLRQSPDAARLAGGRG